MGGTGQVDATEAPAAPLLALDDVNVAFGRTIALRNATLHVRPGEIVGLLGHNGAGKSTLVNVATGAVRPQAGTLSVAGKEIALRGEPSQMEEAGIKVIHQVPALAGNLSIADNITLGRPAEKAGSAARRRTAVEALELLGSSLDVTRPVDSLEFGEKQIVDLARALSSNLQVLLLDEPTGALGQRETERLHALLRRIASEGRGVIYVSHRLRDIFEVCTRIVVLRGGELVLDEPIGELSPERISEALAPGMVAVTHREAKVVPQDSTPSLTVSRGDRELAFSAGEIVGLFGMAAGPQFHILSSLFGVGEQLTATLDGRAYSPARPTDAIRSGVYFVSSDREGDGLVLDMTTLDNLVLPWIERFRSGLAFSRARAMKVYAQARQDLDIRGGHPHAPVAALSGGNRQKVVVGRWLYEPQPRVLLLSQPTQGVDVGARLDIVKALRRLAERGVTVLVASAESDEIALLCDRAVVDDGSDWIDVAAGERWPERMLEALMAHHQQEERA
jgi:ABC-type sugar transport system ATPase subunit